MWLPADTAAKFPDVAAVVPRHPPTTVEVDASDAAALLPVLSGLPGGDHEFRPVTLDAGNGVRVRGRAETGETREVVLGRSVASGPAYRVALDRRVLARALSLGCRTLRLTPDKPFVAAGGEVTLVAAPLEPDLIAPPAADHPEPARPRINPERRTAVKSEANSHTPTRGDPPDPLDLAEQLRAALADAAGVAARLVAALRQGRREKKVLSALVSNLKQLNLGGVP